MPDTKEVVFMIRLRLWPLATMVLLAGALPLLHAGGAAPAPTKEASPTPALDAAATAARIDQLVAARWKDARAQPAERADDAEFVRRVYLDLAGRIPSVAEARQFLDDKRADKRRLLVDRLLDGPRYVTHFAQVWRALMLPEVSSNLQARFLAPGFEAWLRKQLTKNAGYDAMVREMLTLPLEPQNGRNAVFFGQQQGEPTPIAFYLAKEVKAENLAAATARLFMGVKLECAQCHNHPFADWKREQFWGLAAFFAGVQRQTNGDFSFPTRELADRREMTIPGTERVVQASFIDGSEPQWKFRVSARVTLADWLTRADNPYFARAAVNRMWAYFFGTGLVDPVDEMIGAEHVSSNPELLDELARQFAAHKFDLKFLIRAITSSRAYQLSSAATHRSQDDPHLFARMPLRGLTAEQLYDSIAQATGYQENSSNPNVFFFGNQTPRSEFLSKFATQTEKSTDVQTSILQALSLMNGSLTSRATTLESSVTLASLADAPFMDTAERIETLYLSTLSRKPRPTELSRLVRYVDGGGSAEGPPASSVEKEKRYNQALADVFWALLNSGEFFLNH
jgi:hypothetical protein